ncbi:hypothetical protein FYJ43_01625 [Cutibacterium sp. WCA-380-WT-3A]|uniref:Prealbumin-like fold domain-containing protein n=1 Tax=Cutibacterium porci TaxID=2605781 RepID=A0A7K0J4C2_9ACTN|nr:hypothetical protein [Cutibacterium porci]MSS44777.1 hypothetical protein [Cutibacterium porci]
MAGIGAGSIAHAAPYESAEGNTLVLVKHEGEGDTAGQALEGISFQINRVLDVSATSADELGKLVDEHPDVVTPMSKHRLGPGHKAITDSAGHARVSGLPDGVYLVRELPSRVGDVSYSVASPFLVALPNPQDRSDTVRVALKNQPVSVQITASPSHVAPCNNVHIRVAGSAPEPDVRGKLYRYVMVLSMDPALVDRQARRVWISTGHTRVDLIRSKDWTSHADTATGSVVIELTESGLAKLANARVGNPQVRVEADAVATVGCRTAGDKQLTMSVGLFPDGWQVPTDVGRSIDAAASSASTHVMVADGSAQVLPAPGKSGGARPGLKLPVTGAMGAAGGIGAVLVTVIVVLFVARPDRRDKEKNQ